MLTWSYNINKAFSQFGSSTKTLVHFQPSWLYIFRNFKTCLKEKDEERFHFITHLPSQHDCVDFWCETEMIAPDGGVCTDTTPGVKQWGPRASRLNDASIDMCRCDYAWSLGLYFENLASNMFWLLVIPFWLWQKPVFRAFIGHTVSHTWRCPLRSRTYYGGMCKVTNPVIKEICVTSQWRNISDVARFGWYF